jgi:hypothetical protein
MTTTDLQVDDGIGAYLNRPETAPSCSNGKRRDRS